jgi:hypothetical protein
MRLGAGSTSGGRPWARWRRLSRRLRALSPLECTRSWTRWIVEQTIHPASEAVMMELVILYGSLAGLAIAIARMLLGDLQ